ncbi:MAG: replication factor C large subunit [Candidatus Bathyarchaeia archaeon]
MQLSMAWAEKYRPITTSALIGNEEAISEFNVWLRAWTTKRKPKKAVLLVGPPGVGKTSLVRASANDNHFRIVELNASDVRTEKTILNMLTPASTSVTLDSFTVERLHGNMILIDEVDGVFGREDRGGLGAILKIINALTVPIVLTANNLENEKFEDLKKACQVIELFPIRPRLLVALIRHVFDQEGIKNNLELLNELARNAHGDLRSVINDAQLAAAGALHQSARTQQLDERETLNELFTSDRFTDSRKALNESELRLYRDELMLRIHDLLPYVYTSNEKLRDAYDALSRADIAYGRIGANRSRSLAPPPFNLPRRDSVPEWSLLPVALNELATTGLLPVDNDVNHAVQIAPHVSQNTIERYQYRLWSIDHVCGSIAKTCHLSKRKALHLILPYLVAIFRINELAGRSIALSLDLEERDIQFIVSESKTTPIATGPQQTLNPNGFSLTYMGKDKFIQLMRIGLKYDRASGKFSVRRLDNLDAVEQSLSETIAKRVKFERSEEPAKAGLDEGIAKECYVDLNQILCDRCDFKNDCPTYTLTALKFCLCDETMADDQAYEKYVAKNESARPVAATKRPSRKKPIARDKP